MEKELSKSKEPFYIYKKAKLEKEHHRKFTEDEIKNSPITADDISWYLGKVWERSY